MNELAPKPRRLPLDGKQAKVELSVPLTGAGGLIGCRFDPSGRFALFTAQDGTIRILDLLNQSWQTFNGHKAWTRGLAFVPLTKPRPADLLAWEQRRRATLAVTSGRLQPNYGPRPDPFLVISGDYHGKLLWWHGDRPQADPFRVVDAHDGWCRAVDVSHDGKLVASCGNDNLVQIWSTENGSRVRTLRGHDSHVYNVAFHPTLPRLVSVDLMGHIYDWDLNTGKRIRDLDGKDLHKYDTVFMAYIGGARSLQFDRSGKRFALAGITNVSNAFAGVGNPHFATYDWNTGKPTVRKLAAAFQGTGWGVAFHPDDVLIGAGAAGGGQIWFWNGESDTNSHMISVPAGPRDMALDPLGNRLALAGSNGTALIYSLFA